METLKCPNCGGRIMKAEDDIYFCPYCGIGIPDKIEKKHVKLEIASDEKKIIVHKHKDKAKELEAFTSLIIIIFVMAVFMLMIFRSGVH